MGTQTINDLPSSDANFMSNLQAFLGDEFAERDQLLSTYDNRIISGGIGATDASLTHTISTVVAFVNGYYVTDSSVSHTYTATKDTYIYLRDDDSRTVAITGYTIAYDGNFVFAESGTGSTQPTTPTGCTPLFLAVTDDTSITSIDDLRITRPSEYYYPEWYGADPTGTTDSSSAIHRAIVAAAGSPIIFRGTYLCDKLGDTPITTSITLIGEYGATLDGNSDTDSEFLFGGSISSIYVRGITFQNFGDTAVFALPYATETIGYTFSQVTFIDNVFKDCTGGIYIEGEVQRALVRGNRFYNLSSSDETAAIWLGAQGAAAVYSQQDDQKKMIVTDNEIYGVDNSGTSSSSHGIAIHGREGIISNNIIHDITNSYDHTDAEAIYFKCRWGVIANNVIVDGCDAEEGEGAINIKGMRRGETTDVQGYGVLCRGNMLYFTAGAHTGINIATDDVLVDGNYIEGSGEYAIHTFWGNEIDNIGITNNTVVNHRGSYALYVHHYGTGLDVSGNRVWELLATQGTITDAFGIQATGGDGASRNWNFCFNKVYATAASSATTNIGALRIGAWTYDIENLVIANNQGDISHGSAIEWGLRLQFGGGATATNVKVVNNDFNGVPTDTGYPEYISSPSSIAELNWRDNNGWGAFNTSITALEAHHSGLVSGCSGSAVSFTLPAAQVGVEFPFVRPDSYSVKIYPDGSDVIGTGGAGKYLELDTDGDSAVLKCCVSGRWEIVGGYGSYTFEA